MVPQNIPGINHLLSGYIFIYRVTVNYIYVHQFFASITKHVHYPGVTRIREKVFNGDCQALGLLCRMLDDTNMPFASYTKILVDSFPEQEQSLTVTGATNIYLGTNPILSVSGATTATDINGNTITLNISVFT